MPPPSAVVALRDSWWGRACDMGDVCPFEEGLLCSRMQRSALSRRASVLSVSCNNTFLSTCVSRKSRRGQICETFIGVRRSSLRVRVRVRSTSFCETFCGFLLSPPPAPDNSAEQLRVVGHGRSRAVDGRELKSLMLLSSCGWHEQFIKKLSTRLKYRSRLSK